MRLIVALAAVTLLAACASDDSSASAVQSAKAPVLADAAPAHDVRIESGKPS